MAQSPFFQDQAQAMPGQVTPFTSQSDGTLSLLPMLMGNQQQQQGLDANGLQGALGTVLGEIQTGKQKIDEQQKQRDGIKSRMYELLAKRGGLAPDQAAQVQQNPQEALIAGLIALAGGLGGARNATQAFNQFQGIRQNQFNAEHQHAQELLDNEYAKRKQELDAQFQTLNMEHEDATAQIAQGAAQQQNLIKEYSDLAQRQSVQDTAKYNADSRESIAMFNADAKLKQIAALNGGKLDLEKFKRENPEVMQNYNSILATRGIDAANKYMDSFAQTPEFKNQLTQAQTDKTIAQTETENQLREPRLKELAAKLGLIDAQTGAYNALAGKREQETMKIISMADDANLLPEELALVEQSFNPQMESMAKSISQIKLKLQEAQKVLKVLGPDDVGYKEAFKDVSLWTEQLRFMESAMKEDEAAKKQAIADAKKGKASAPNGGAYTRINYSSRARGDASRGNINRNLLNDLQSAGDSLGLNVTIGTAMSGHSPTTRSGNKSRHSVGNAVDITHINGYSVSSPTGRKLADRLVAKLVESGAIRNSENGNRKAVLWQMQDHYDHIHYSNNS